MNRMWTYHLSLFILIALSNLVFGGSVLVPKTPYSRGKHEIYQLLKFGGFCFSIPRASRAAIDSSNDSNFDDYLTRRVVSSDADNYRPGIQIADIFYPQYFAGKWNVTSYITRVEAPLGAIAFGGQSRLDAVAQEIKNDGSPLSYFAKFNNFGGNVIADRLYNVEQIAIASMGPDSVIDDFQSNNNLANNIRLTISPKDANGGSFDVDLTVTDREQKMGTKSDTFDALERTIQVVSAKVYTPVSPPLRKEIETITSYKRISESRIQAIQRTATFLSSADPRYRIAFAKNPDVENRAVDIRMYKCIYEKL